MNNNDVQEKKNTFLSSPSMSFAGTPVINPVVQNNTEPKSQNTFVQPVVNTEVKPQVQNQSIIGTTPVINPVVQNNTEPKSQNNTEPKSQNTFVQPAANTEVKPQVQNPSIFGTTPVINPVVQNNTEPKSQNTFVQPVVNTEVKSQVQNPSIFGTTPVINPVVQNNTEPKSQNTFVQPVANTEVKSQVQNPSIFGTTPVINPVAKNNTAPKEQSAFVNTSSNGNIFTGFGTKNPVKKEIQPVSIKNEQHQPTVSPTVLSYAQSNSEMKFINITGNGPVKNTAVNTNGNYTSIFRTEQKVTPKENNKELDEKHQLPKPTELPKVEKVEKNNEESAPLIMTIEDLMRSSYSEKVELERKTKKANKWFFRLSIASGLAFAAVLLFAIFGKTNVFNFIGSRVYYQDKKATITGVHTTAVVVDNKYKVAFNDTEDEREQAKKYIVQDGNNQKKKCSDEEVKKVESEIESEYGIVAVNLCEMDPAFAKEIKQMIGVVYKEFPMIKSELTNLTLNNMDEGSGILAFFNPAMKFADSNKLGGYPKIYKMIISLNSEYFLDESLQELVRTSASSEYFPSGATRTTIVAHEFGHYLSFLAQLHNSNMDKLLLITRKDYKSYVRVIEDSNEGVFSKKILEEALKNYNQKYDNGFSDLEEFRNSISGYAAAYDQTGAPIYDETIAESFHDYYINRGNAKRASLEVMEVLKKYLNN